MKGLICNECCRYSYYGGGVLRCSFTGLEGYVCVGLKDCIHFEKSEIEID